MSTVILHFHKFGFLFGILDMSVCRNDYNLYVLYLRISYHYVVSILKNYILTLD